MVLFYAVAGAVILLFVSQYGSDVRAALQLAGNAPWYRLPILRGLLVLLALLTVPPLVVEFGPLGATLDDARWTWGFSVVVSALISYTWYRYLTWLDVFEPERKRTLLLVFVLACITTSVVPLLGGPLERLTGLVVEGRFAHDLLYTSVVVGMVEELAKLLPYLVVLAFTREVNEPYDHLLYISVSALGFAFVENILYLGSTGLFAVGGRALLAAVAHMCFSSIIGYGIARTMGKGMLRTWGVGLLLYLLASLAHGFYDVWLISPGLPTILTTFFFLGTIQLWVIMKNNLVNLSPFLEPHRKLRSTMFRYRIVNALLAVFMLAFTAVFLLHGRAEAWHLLAAQGPLMGVLLLIIALSFGNYHVVPGYIAKVRVSANPIRWFVPMAGLGADLSGSRIRVDIPERTWRRMDMPELRRSLPVMGLLERRVVVDGDADWYLFRPERRLNLGGGFEDLFLMKLDAKVDTIPTEAYVRMLLHRFEGTPRITDGQVEGRTVLFAPRFFAQLVPPIHATVDGASGLSAMGGHGLS